LHDTPGNAVFRFFRPRFSVNQWDAPYQWLIERRISRAKMLPI
jgi:hypothetical protein